jgi:hypothetical protein
MNTEQDNIDTEIDDVPVIPNADNIPLDCATTTEPEQPSTTRMIDVDFAEKAMSKKKPRGRPKKIITDNLTPAEKKAIRNKKDRERRAKLKSISKKQQKEIFVPTKMIDECNTYSDVPTKYTPDKLRITKTIDDDHEYINVYMNGMNNMPDDLTLDIRSCYQNLNKTVNITFDKNTPSSIKVIIS